MFFLNIFIQSRITQYADHYVGHTWRTAYNQKEFITKIMQWKFEKIRKFYVGYISSEIQKNHSDYSI